MQETRVWSLGWEDPLEEEIATHSSILPWEIPWTEEPGGLQFPGSQRVRNDWAQQPSTFEKRSWVTSNPRVHILVSEPQQDPDNGKSQLKKPQRPSVLLLVNYALRMKFTIIIESSSMKGIFFFFFKNQGTVVSVKDRRLWTWGHLATYGTSLVTHKAKKLPAMYETQVHSLGMNCCGFGLVS